MKECKDCGLQSCDLSLFVKDKQYADGVQSLCKKCGSERTMNSQLKKRYGITRDQYNEMFASQKGCCYICGIHQQELTRRLAVDHNHNTGEVRYLLCHGCNTGLGAFKDNPYLLEKAARYLKENGYYGS